MPDASGSTTMQNQINLMKEMMERGFGEIKTMLTALDTRMRQIEQSEARCYPVIDSRVGEVEKDVATHEKEIEALRQLTNDLQIAIEKQVGFNRIVSWVGGIVGSAIIVWVISQLMGLIH